MLVLAALAWGAGWRTGWHELMIVAGAAAASVVVAYVFTLGRAQLAVQVALRPERVVAGDHASGRLAVTNTAGRHVRALQLEVPIGAGLGVFDIPGLAAGAVAEELFAVPTHRRAVLRVGPVTSVRSDPLALVRRAVTWTDVQELYVHPRTTGLDRLGSGFLRDLEGQTTNDLSTSDVAFHTLREYVPGDDRRHVHWRTSARLGKLMIRQFVDTRQSHLAVVLATDAAAYAEDDEFELAVSIAASLGTRALRDEQSVSLVAGDRQLACESGRQLLDELARVEPSGTEGSLVHGAIAAKRVAAQASIVALVSGASMPLADLRVAANRLSPDVRVVGVRADLGGAAGFRPVGALTVLNVPALDELGRLLAGVRQS